MHYMFSYCNLKYTNFLSRQCSRMNEQVAAVMNKYVKKLQLPSSLQYVRKPIILLLLKSWFVRLPQIINNYSGVFFWSETGAEHTRDFWLTDLCTWVQSSISFSSWADLYKSVKKKTFWIVTCLGNYTVIGSGGIPDNFKLMVQLMWS